MLQSFPAGVILADGEFSKLESVVIEGPLELTNKYLEALAYYEVRRLSIPPYIILWTAFRDAISAVVHH